MRSRKSVKKSIYLAATAVIAAFWLVNPDPALAQQAPSGLSAALKTPLGGVDAEVYSRLTDMAQQAGETPVIIDLNIPFTPGAWGHGAEEQAKGIAAAQQSVLAALSGAKTSSVKLYQNLPQMALAVDAGGLAVLSHNPMVRQVWQDTPQKMTLAQSIPQIQANLAWSAGFTGLGWTVAILDTGVDKTHSFFTGKVVSEACYSTNAAGSGSSSACPGGLASSTAVGSGVPCSLAWDSGCYHGTHVAGIAAGKDPGGVNSGVAKDANIISVQVFSYFTALACGGATCVMAWDSDIIAGLDRVFALRAVYNIAAVNLSLGGGAYSAPCDASMGAMKTSIDNLRAANIATVVSSGNDGYTTSMGSPACISSAVSVGSVCDNAVSASCGAGYDGVASYSNVAGFISLLAPGSAITSAYPGNLTATANGTSMAAPHITGAWAVVMQKAPAGTGAAQVLSALQSTGTAVNDARAGGVVTGMKRINLNAALSSFDAAVTVILAGSGTVSDGGTLNCSSPAVSCSAVYLSGAPVSLLATPAAGQVFAGWTGGPCAGTLTNPCAFAAVTTSMTATFTAPTATLLPSLLNFGPVPAPFASSKTLALTFSNLTGAPINSLSINPIAGANAGLFSAAWAGGSCALPMANAASCQLNVTLNLAAATVGPITASITVKYGASNTAPALLQATGVTPGVAITPNPISMTAVVGSSSAVAVTLTNNYDMAGVTINALGVTSPIAAPFSISADGCTGSPLAALGSTCAFNLVFTPSAAGTFTYNLDAGFTDSTALAHLSATAPVTALAAVSVPAPSGGGGGGGGGGGTAGGGLGNQPPYIPGGGDWLVSPEEGAAGNGNIAFVWKKLIDLNGDPVTYKLYVCPNGDFESCGPTRVIQGNESSRQIAFGLGALGASLALFGAVFQSSRRRRAALLASLLALLASGAVLACANSSSNSSKGCAGAAQDEHCRENLGLAPGYYKWKVTADDGRDARAESSPRSLTVK